MPYSASLKLACSLGQATAHSTARPYTDLSTVTHEVDDLPLGLPSGKTTLSGLSIGLFAAAAISVSKSLVDVAINGVESVRVAFRLGIHVDGVSERLESRDQDGTYDSWAFVLTGLSVEKVQEELDRYNSESVNSSPHLQTRKSLTSFSPTPRRRKFSSVRRTRPQSALQVRHLA